MVRYFGGIKLGAGGLVRAYTRSVAEAIQKAPKTETVKVQVYTLAFSYDLIGKIDYLLKDSAVILQKEYAEQVSYLFYTEDPELLKKLQECTSGRFPALFVENRIVERPLP